MIPPYKVSSASASKSSLAIENKADSDCIEAVGTCSAPRYDRADRRYLAAAETPPIVETIAAVRALDHEDFDAP